MRWSWETTGTRLREGPLAGQLPACAARPEPPRRPPQARQLRLLQPYVLNCCYSRDSGIVLETFLMLQGLVQYLTWQRSSSFLVQLSFMLRPFFEEVGSSAAPPPPPPPGASEALPPWP